MDDKMNKVQNAVVNHRSITTATELSVYALETCQMYHLIFVLVRAIHFRIALYKALHVAPQHTLAGKKYLPSFSKLKATKKSVG